MMKIGNLPGRLAGVCAAAFCAFVAARADDVYLLRSDAKINNVDVRSFEAAGNWSNGEAPSDAHDYYVMTNYSLRITGSTAAHVFKGNSLTLGGTGSGDNFKGLIMGWGGQADVTISNLVLHQSTIQCNNEGWFYLKGTTTVRDTVGDRIFTGINHNTDGGRNFDLQCKPKTVGDESPQVILKHGRNAASTYTTFKMSGDFTECKAWFEVQGQNSGLAIFLLDTATFGAAFDSVKTNAVQLRTNSKIVFTPNAVQNANAGISVPAGQTAYFGTRTYSASGNCKGSVQYDYPDHDLLLPVFGSGTFTKEDDGRITLKNDWSGFHGTVAIEGGSLILTDDMTTSADMRVVVKAGGVLETARTDGTYGGLDVTFEAGAGLIVPYNAETGVSAPITLGQSFLESCTYPVGLKLSQPISFPVNATNRLPVAKVDPAIRVVTGADFTDTTTKTYDPRGKRLLGSVRGCLYARQVEQPVEHGRVCLERPLGRASGRGLHPFGHGFVGRLAGRPRFPQDLRRRFARVPGRKHRVPQRTRRPAACHGRFAEHALQLRRLRPGQSAQVRRRANLRVRGQHDGKTP